MMRAPAVPRARWRDRRVAMVIVAAAFAVTMAGTTLPTPLYPRYEEHFGFGELMVTVIFATYAVGVAGTLVVLGGLSDRIGRRPVLLAGLGCGLVSSLVFLIPALVALFAGRLMSGLSAGIFTGTATAAIIDLADPARRARAGLLAAAVNMLGLGVGPLLSGVLADQLPHPLATPYLVHVGLVTLAAAAMRFVPETVERRGFRLEPLRVGGLPPRVRGVFVRASTAGFAGFAVLGLFTAVSPAMLTQVLHRPGGVVVGLLVLALFASSTFGQIASASMPDRLALPLGCLGLLAGVAAIGVGIGAASLPAFCAGAVIAGLGQGMSFRAGLTAVGIAAPEDVRGRVVASYFLVLYIAISLPVIGIGAAAQVFGLVTAGLAFTGVVAALTGTALVSTVLAGRKAAPADER